MSQTLALIVAASVLMMTALTVIFMVQGGLGDVFGSSNTQSCYSTIKSKCQFTNDAVATPSSCERAGLIDESVPGLDTQIGASQTQCPVQ